MRNQKTWFCRWATMVAPNCVIGRGKKQNDRVNKFNAFLFCKCIVPLPLGLHKKILVLSKPFATSDFW